MEKYLAETKYLDFSHPKIQEALRDEIKIDFSSSDSRAKAIAIHDYVREKIAFGFNRKFYDMRASEVLESRRGFCNNKSTLFAAMLRALGIPARVVFVDIDKEILHGVVDPRTPYVDHSYVEVSLDRDDKWLRVDSYIVDSQLFDKAKLLCKESGRRVGWGVHRDGTNRWNGSGDSFSQFVRDDAANISTKEYGVFDDVGDFYQRAENTWNKANFIQNTVFFLLAGKISADIDKIRQK